MTLAVMIGLPIWMIYPANSPRHLNNIYNPQRIIRDYNSVDIAVKEMVTNNKFDYRILNFQEDIGIGRDDNNIMAIMGLVIGIGDFICCLTFYFLIFSMFSLFSTFW